MPTIHVVSTASIVVSEHGAITRGRGSESALESLFSLQHYAHLLEAMHAYAYISLARLLTRRTAVIYEVQMAYMTCNVMERLCLVYIVHTEMQPQVT